MMPKFRAWDKNKRWMVYDVQDAYDGLWSERNSDEINDYYGYVSTFQSFTDEKRFNFMQSTGLEDKNGVEIYEGDIVRYTWDLPDYVNATEKGKKIRVGKVFWNDWRASFAVGKKSVNSDLFRYVRNGNTVEVIGNIYENSDLLEVAE